MSREDYLELTVKMKEIIKDVETKEELDSTLIGIMSFGAFYYMQSNGIEQLREALTVLGDQLKIRLDEEMKDKFDA